MRIAFDLDDTLIPGKVPFPLEPVPRGLLAPWFCDEPLRLGTVQLFRELRRRGQEVWIDTTSLRKPLATKLVFYLYGARVGRVIHDDVHRRHMARLGNTYKTCTKFPPAFGIGVRIDDKEGVRIESRQYGFEMILARPEDDAWVRTVKVGLGLG